MHPYGKGYPPGRRSFPRPLNNPQQPDGMYECSVSRTELPYNSFLLKCPDTTATLNFKLRVKAKQPPKQQVPQLQPFQQPQPKQQQLTTKSLIKKIPLKSSESSELVGSTPPPSTVKGSLSPRIMIKPSSEDCSALEADNKRMQQQLKSVRKENERLRTLVDKNEQCSQQFRQLIDKMNREMQQLSLLNRNVPAMQQQKHQLEQQLLKGRIKLATIFNLASDIGGSALTDQLQLAGGYLESSPR